MRKCLWRSVLRPRPSVGTFCDGMLRWAPSKQNGQQGFCIEITSRGGKNVNLYATSDAERQEWCALLRKYAVHLNIENGFQVTSKVLHARFALLRYHQRDHPCARCTLSYARACSSAGPLRYCTQVLGTGAYAVVKLAKDRVTKQEVALKIIKKSRLDNEERGLLVDEACDHDPATGLDVGGNHHGNVSVLTACVPPVRSR